ncbi:MAG: O-antigen ligase family protein [Gloeobacterales cyanobacterium]
MDIFFSSRQSQYLWIVFILLTSVVMGIAAATKPQILTIGIIAAFGIALLFNKFEFSILSLLIIRSSLDPFSKYQLASLLALAIDGITICYVIGCLLLHKRIKADWWMIFLLFWTLLTALWPLATSQGWLPKESEAFSIGIREWIRFASYGAIYTLVMQLRDKIPGQKLVSYLLLSLIVPISAALGQLYFPTYLTKLWYELRPFEELGHTRINGTLGHPNTFAVYLLLMGSLAWWKYRATAQKRWLALIGVILFIYLKTNSLAGIAMVLVLIGVLGLPRLSFKSLATASLAITLALGIFISTDIGRTRLDILQRTPLLNGDFSISKAVNLSYIDGNSFSWRIAQWSYLIKAWEHSPLFGYGLGTTELLTPFHNGAHNDFIRALAETGLVGLFMFLVLWAALFFRIADIWRQAPPSSSQKELCLIMLGVYAAVTVGMTTEHYWQTTAFYFYWMTIIAVAGWKWPKEEVKPKLLPKPETYRLTAPIELEGLRR